MPAKTCATSSRNLVVHVESCAVACRSFLAVFQTAVKRSNALAWICRRWGDMILSGSYSCGAEDDFTDQENGLRADRAGLSGGEPVPGGFGAGDRRSSKSSRRAAHEHPQGTATAWRAAQHARR